MEPSMTASGEFTVELMQQILRQAEKDNTIEVLPCLNVVELNDSFHAGSNLSRVTVKYTHHGDVVQHSLSLIVKVLTKGSTDLSDIQLNTFFPREVQMYEEILPRMSELLSKALLGQHSEFYPRVYYTRKTPNYLLAIEDLTPKGFKPPKRQDGLDLTQCLLAVRALAKFHAASVIIHREDESLYSLFDKHYSDLSNDNIKGMTDEFISIITQKMKQRKEFDSSWAERMQNRFKTIHDDMKDFRKRNDSSFNVLIHGDFGSHNVMYRYSDSSGQVEAVMLVDFQTCSYGSPVIDLHQLIFSAANDLVRANHIDTLLREYHAELTSTLVALGEARADIISLPQLLAEFDRVLPYGLFFVTCLLPVSSFDPETTSAVATGDIANISTVGVHRLEPLLTDSFFKSLEYILPFFIRKNVI